MIVTEEEAKTKRCQESFASAPAVTDTGHMIGIHYGGTYSVQTAPTHCIGSACMAWCWDEQATEIEIFKAGETNADFVKRRDAILARRKGMCGKLQMRGHP